jgi:hypothetical protein
MTLYAGIVVGGVALLVVYHLLAKKNKIVEDQDIIDVKNANKKLENISPEIIAKINADIENLPECPEIGHTQVLNFAYWLSLFKILNLNSRME